MARGVFIHRADSIYDDSPAEQYQFPSQYRGRVDACVGDWIVYYEPRKVAGTRGYFAVARVQQIIPDPKSAGMFIAIIEPGSYLPFVQPVPFAGAEGVVERGVLNAAGKISGRAQSAVRPISPEDFTRIIDRGLPDDIGLLPRVDLAMPDNSLDRGLNYQAKPFQYERDPGRISYLTTRIVRDRVFRQIVLQAYDSQCAFTGLKLINGKGRAEAEAAHIKPVEAAGPDDVRNGIALSGTVHWMFDRGLISLEDDLEILVSRQTNDADGIRAMINKNGRARPPIRPLDRPHPHFLAWHRENCFKR